MSTAASNSSSSRSRGKTSVQQQRPQNAQASSSRLPPLRETAAVDLERELPTSLRVRLASLLTFSEAIAELTLLVTCSLNVDRDSLPA